MVTLEGIWVLSGRVVGAVWARLVELGLCTRPALQDWVRADASGPPGDSGVFSRAQLARLLGATERHLYDSLEYAARQGPSFPRTPLLHQ
eukprot:2964637-Alexandrium_andersonii.AAC.1